MCSAEPAMDDRRRGWLRHRKMRIGNTFLEGLDTEQSAAPPNAAYRRRRERAGHLAWLSDQSGTLDCAKNARDEEDRVAHTYPLRHHGSSRHSRSGATPESPRDETWRHCVWRAGFVGSGTRYHNAREQGACNDIRTSQFTEHLVCV